MITAIFHRRRLVFWLIRAYIKKRKRTIITFFLAGILVALVGWFLTPFLGPRIFTQSKTVGIVGSYSIDTLPTEIQRKVSIGLTKIAVNGEAIPSAALDFKASSDGKRYTFYLHDNLYWQDGKKFQASDVNYNFKDISVSVASEQEIVFTLNEPFAPFPIVVSQPLFRTGLIGLVEKNGDKEYGSYKVTDVEFKDSYVIKLVLDNIDSSEQHTRIVYKFFSNGEEAKVRYMLGEVDELVNVVDAKPFNEWKNTQVSEKVADDQLVALFYNTSIPILSDKSVRQALTYAIPQDFADSAKATSPISRTSWAYAPQNKFNGGNLVTAKKLLGESSEASQAGTIKLTLTTTAQFKDLAESIKVNWAKIGVETEIAVVGRIPSDPQVLLERFKIPADPDQYALWHSTQQTNISHFSSPRIDKLLEDGRRTINPEERAQIYAEFQKHIVEESPAAFLYYPTVYTISRK